MTERQNDTHILLGGNTAKVLLLYITPIAFSLFLQSLYGITDLWIVARYCQSESILAVSSAAQVTSFFTMAITGMTAGAAVLMAGSGESGRADQTAAAGMRLLVILGVFLGLLMYLGAGRIAEWMQMPEGAAQEMGRYLRGCSLGMLFTAVYQMVNAIYKSAGRSKISLLFAAFSGTVNLFGDLLLVGQWGMGAAGAGAATMAAQGLCAVLALVYLRKSPVFFLKKTANFSGGHRLFSSAKKGWDKTAEIIRLSSPIILNSLLTGISILIVTSMINSAGIVEAAGVGIAEKMFAFFVLVPTAFQEGLGTYTAIHLAAGRRSQAVKGLWTAFACSFAFCGLISLVTFFRGRELAGLFQADPTVLTAAAAYLRGDSLEYVFLALMYCLQGYLNGLGKTGFVMVSALVTAFLVRIPLIFWLCCAEQISAEAIGWGMSFSAAVGSLLCLAYYWRNEKRQK